jgi:CheY-like chemotaxis protein
MKLEPPSLLITDDDRDFRETLRGLFESRGYRTLLAADGDEALEIVGRQPVHLALLDMHMPRLSGLETIRRIRQMRFDVLPCILISAALDAEIEEEARRQRAFSVLAKPIRLREITGLVQQALSQTYNWRPDFA